MLTLKKIVFHQAVIAVFPCFLLLSCSNVSDLKVSVADTIKANTETSLTIVRTGTGSGEWDLGDKDGFNYHFSSYPSGQFKVDILEGKQNEYCRTTESNEVSDGKMHNEVRRDML